MNKAVLILSGGMDSTTLLHYATKQMGFEVFALSFDYGQKLSKELECARWQCGALKSTHRLIDLSGLIPLFGDNSLTTKRKVPDVQTVLGDPQPPTYVPNRNQIFLSIAAAWAETVGANTILYGAQKHDVYGYWDTTPDFVYRLQGVYELNRKNPIALLAPFVHFSKSDELRIGLDLGIDYSHTWSCYRGGENACGKCATCSERLAAWAAHGIPDPVPYEWVPADYAAKVGLNNA